MPAAPAPDWWRKIARLERELHLQASHSGRAYLLHGSGSAGGAPLSG